MFMSRLLAWIGRSANIIVPIIAVVSGLATIIPFVQSYVYTSSKLVADIYPMEFRLPVSLDAVLRATRTTNQPMDRDIANLLSVGGANGFARIDLLNGGSLPLEDIRIRAFGATVYAKGTPNMNDSSVVPSDDTTGIKLPTLEQGSSVTIYVWAGIVEGTYTNWDTLDKLFQITFSKGVAAKRFHIQVGTIAEWIDRNLVIFAVVLAVLFILSLIVLIMRVLRYRQNRNPGSISALETADACPYCGVRSWRLKETAYSGREARNEIWACSSCHKEQDKWVPTGITPERAR